MTSLRQYRQYSIWAIIIMVLALVLSFAALWNSLLTGNVKHEGWVVLFQMLVFIPGMLLFYIAFKTSDSKILDSELNKAFESGKSSILKELENRSKEEKKDQETQQEDIDRTVAQILSGIKKTWNSKTGHGILASLAKKMGFVQGIFYLKENGSEYYQPAGEYALTGQVPAPFKNGEGFAGQAAESKSTIIMYDIPEQYFNISSGLGSSKPRYLLLVPVLFENECYGVIELAAFIKPDKSTEKILQLVSAELGNLIHTFFAA